MRAGTTHTPDAIERMRLIKLGKQPSDITRKKLSEANIKRYENPEEHEKTRTSTKKMWDNAEVRTKIVISQINRHKTPEHKLAHSKGQQKRYERPEEHLKTVEATIGGFWYGNVTHYDTIQYCELFNNDFKKRCRAFWDNKSVISGKTNEDNIRRGVVTDLTVHHVYHNKKACCNWDKDTQGYYTHINIGKRGKPNWVRYDIKGDPNKFVLLTFAENNMVEHNKLYWIKVFEDLIESRGGKSFYTKEEMNSPIHIG